jgi:hypothetical protein
MEKVMKILHCKSLYFVGKKYEFKWFKQIEKLALEIKSQLNELAFNIYNKLLSITL